MKLAILLEYWFNETYNFYSLYIFSLFQFFKHHSYKVDTKENDIALLKLKESVELSDDIIPACISDVDLAVPGAELVVTGWVSNNDFVTNIQKSNFYQN